MKSLKKERYRKMTRECPEFFIFFTGIDHKNYEKLFDFEFEN